MSDQAKKGGAFSGLARCRQNFSIAAGTIHGLPVLLPEKSRFQKVWTFSAATSSKTRSYGSNAREFLTLRKPYSGFLKSRSRAGRLCLIGKTLCFLSLAVWRYFFAWKNSYKQTVQAESYGAWFAQLVQKSTLISVTSFFAWGKVEQIALYFRYQ